MQKGVVAESAAGGFKIMSDGLTYISLTQLLACQHAARQLDLTRGLRTLSQGNGQYPSAFRARGIDFSELRHYQYGDDVRSMEWRVTARTGKPHIKCYQSERERPVWLAVDLSASLFFGTRIAFKSVIAAKMAATLAWAAVLQNDQIGGLVFSHQYHTDIRTARRQQGIFPLLKALSLQSLKPAASEGSHYFNKALSRLLRVMRPGSLLFIISDFRDLNEDSKPYLQQLRLHNDVVSICLFDAVEMKAPAANQYPISNGFEQMLMNTDSLDFCKQYEAQFTGRLDKIKQILEPVKIPFLWVNTADSLEARLLQWFGKQSYSTKVRA
ncbi:MAG: vWA domain-containing protein [Gammaproteobacteria bacterium]|nr:vWA domain-containing protein [Gammaproteobacteria bacterium]